MRRMIGWGVIVGATAVLIGIAAPKPAAADDWRIEYRSGHSYDRDYRDRDRDRWEHERWERERREREWRGHERREHERYQHERYEHARYRDYDRDIRW